MKVALVGAGKTGKYVCKLHNPVEVFHSRRLPDLESLKSCDVIISFLPGPAFESYIPLFIESSLPLITGSTGIKFGSELARELEEKKLKWILASNFSLGMNLIHEMILTFGKADKLFEDYSFKIHEVHHTKKLDAPSGTALSWKKWLGPCGEKTSVTYEREGDVIGFHKLTLCMKNEEITLSHKALDRSIFAKGALWAAHRVLTDSKIKVGLNRFSRITREEVLK